MADFFGAPFGRPVPYHSALQSTQEGRGFNSWMPMPFRRHVRIDLVNAAPRRVTLYYQVDVTLGPVGDDEGILHASFRRENPTTMRQDFTIAGLQLDYASAFFILIALRSWNLISVDAMMRRDSPESAKPARIA